MRGRTRNSLSVSHARVQERAGDGVLRTRRWFVPVFMGHPAAASVVHIITINEEGIEWKKEPG